MKRFSWIACAVLLAAFSWHAEGFAGTKVLRLGTDHAHDFVTTIALRDFAAMVDKETGGAVKVEVYDGGQLGQEKACIEQVQFGALDMAKTSISPLSEFIPSLTALNLPYLFRDLDHMWKVMKGDVGKELLGKADEAGMVALCWIDAGSRCFYGKNPIRDLDDLKGLKIRVPESKMMMAMIEALGGHATPMPGNDVYSALQTGVCDAAENNIPRYLDMSHQEVAKHLILDRHNILPEVLLVSKNTWANLDAAEQKAVLKCAAALEDDMIVKWAAGPPPNRPFWTSSTDTASSPSPRTRRSSRACARHASLSTTSTERNTPIWSRKSRP